MSSLLPPSQALEAYLSGLLAAPAQAVAAEPKPGYIVFRVARLDFALPAARVRAVLPWPSAQSQPAPSADGWLGQLSCDGQTIEVADTAAHLLPGIQPSGTAVIRQVLWLADTALGLGCEAVIDSERAIDEQQVCWSGAGTTRPWLAGTLAQPRCALIDPQGLLAMLEKEK